MAVIHIFYKGVLVIVIRGIGQKVLPVNMAFGVGVIAVVKVIAGELGFVANEVVVIKATAPDISYSIAIIG